MSLTVVCATMLAAVSCEQLRRESSGSLIESSSILCGSTRTWKTAHSTFIKGERERASRSSSFLQQLAELAEQAIFSSFLCSCESSGTISDTFIQCRTCRVSCCRKCMNDHAGPNLRSHELYDVAIPHGGHNPHIFQEKLRKITPTALYFDEGSLDDLIHLDNDVHRVSSLPGLVFNLHRIKRDVRRWLLLYYARDNHGVGEAIAEVRIILGELKTQSVIKDGSVERGAIIELTSFMPALEEPIVFGKIKPCATLCVQEGVKTIPPWSIKTSEQVTQMTVEGFGVTPSLRKEVGLTGTVVQQLQTAAQKPQNRKHFAKAKQRGEERRWIYAKRWEEWPETICIGAIDDSLPSQAVTGRYIRAPCRQTTNQSALWVRSDVVRSPQLFIIILPNVNRTGPDRVVISSSINHLDYSSIVATFPRYWEPSDAFHPPSQTELCFATWTPSEKLCVCSIESQLTVESPAKPEDVLFRISGLSNVQILMLSGGDIADECGLMNLQVHGGQQAQQIIRVFNAACVPPILSFVAKYGMKYSIDAKAKYIKLVNDEAYGFCEAVVPFRPVEEWTFNKERNCMDRIYQHGAAREYVLQLQRAKKPFEFILNRKERILDVKCFPRVAAHHAAANLLRERHVKGDVNVAFKLSDTSQQLDQEHKPFVVHNCSSESPTQVKLRKPFALYPRQQRVVTRILAIEKREKSYEEVELSEFDMPGSSGFSLMAKASRTASLRGCVVADAIGAGKTVISIAVILKGIEAARRNRAAPRKSGASLVVVPPGLIDQWESEILKFTEWLDVLKIYDARSLRKITLGQILRADIVICPIDILESQGYFESLLRCSGLDEMHDHVPALPQYSGQAEQIAAVGLWIPHTSQDPYGGGNNPRSQRRRDDSAFYTHIYTRAILALRNRQLEEKHLSVPLEYFEWERVIVDEIHESLCTTKVELERSNPDGAIQFKERNRRAGRELLGITTADISKRPLTYRASILGLTGTPLLDSSCRVTELANLMGGIYVTGLSSHWRKLEKESGRDIFLSSYLEPRQSREVRKVINKSCQKYLDLACCRNRAEEEMDGIKLAVIRRKTFMGSEEKCLYFASQSGIEESRRSFSVSPKDFDASHGADIYSHLRQNAALPSRGLELLKICKEILRNDGNTKIIVFADARIGAVKIAADFLNSDERIGCTQLQPHDSVQEMNRKISFYQHADATEEDRRRPRVLVLSFENAAGLNLQTESYNVILFHPLYNGHGGTSDDPVQDVSVELQAIGRVFRNGQTRPKVFVYRIEVVGPNGEACLDTHLIQRNTDPETVAMATSADD